MSFGFLVFFQKKTKNLVYTFIMIVFIKENKDYIEKNRRYFNRRGYNSGENSR